MFIGEGGNHDGKEQEKVLTSGVERFNRVSLPTNILFSLIFILLALLTVIPLIFVIIVSFSSAESVRKSVTALYPWSGVFLPISTYGIYGRL